MNGAMSLAGLLETGDRLVSDVTSFAVNGVVPLLGVVLVLWTWGKTKSAVAALVAAIMAGLIWWFVANMATVRDAADEDLNPVTETVSAPARPGAWGVGS